MMTEDRIIRSDMERLNSNQVLLASSKRNEEALMKLVDLKQKEVWVFFSFVPPPHTHNVNFLLQNTVDLKKFTRVQKETGQAHTRKNFSVAEHTNTSDPESPEMQLVKWDSTWRRESRVCLSYCYLLPQASSLGHCWRQDCRLAEYLGSDPVQPFVSST